MAEKSEISWMMTKGEKIKATLAASRAAPGWVHPMKGRTFSPEARARMGRKKGCDNSHRAVPRTPEERARISAATRASTPRGAACHSFKDGLMVERRGERHSQEYKRWRFDVFSRDRFTCRHCLDDRGGNLNAHHILRFATHAELRYTVSNGLTLCDHCHKTVHRLLDGVEHNGFPGAPT